MALNGSDTQSRQPPRIGITTELQHARWGPWDRQAALLPTVYVDTLYRAGGLPLLLPPIAGSAQDAIRTVDGLILSGGTDLSPEQYNQEPHASIQHTCPQRDDWELRLLRAALDQHVPVLGICRGVQVLTAAFGGTLQQHLPDALGSGNRHQPAPGRFGMHRVDLCAETRIARILGEYTDVRCHHHQALATIPDALRVTGYATDGTVEAVESPHHRFLLGVQWHPEENGDDLRLLHALVDVAGVPSVPSSAEPAELGPPMHDTPRPQGERP